MAGSKSDALEADILNFLYRTATTLAGATGATKPANRWLATFSADPTDAGSGAEITTFGVARVAIPVADASWSAPAVNGTNYRITNASQISVGPTTGNAGIATHWGLVTSASGAFTLLHHGNFDTSVDLSASGRTLTIAAGALAIDEG